MTSLERIKEYTSLENEPIESAESVVDTNWPKNGGIEFKNVSFRYSDSMPDVLKNLTFKINPGEKVKF
jgi:ABC-type multidrug transport system fused ATPase/permease subunit